LVYGYNFETSLARRGRGIGKFIQIEKTNFPVILFMLTSTGGQEYPFLVKGGADSSLKGRIVALGEKANYYLLELGPFFNQIFYELAIDA